MRVPIHTTKSKISFCLLTVESLDTQTAFGAFLFLKSGLGLRRGLIAAPSSGEPLRARPRFRKMTCVSVYRRVWQVMLYQADKGPGTKALKFPMP